MSNTMYRLKTAAFPQDYADIMIEILAITPTNFLSIKAALYDFHFLDDELTDQAMQTIAARIQADESEEA